MVLHACISMSFYFIFDFQMYQFEKALIPDDAEEKIKKIYRKTI